MHLYLVHCGFYDEALSDGVYESHVNYFIAAESFDEAKAKIRLHPEFKAKKMHVDGLQEIRAVEGYGVTLERDEGLKGQSQILNFKHRDLAPKK